MWLCIRCYSTHNFLFCLACYLSNSFLFSSSSSSYVWITPILFLFSLLCVRYQASNVNRSGIHALNVLRAIIHSVGHESTLGPFLSEALMMCIKGYSSNKYVPVWHYLCVCKRIIWKLYALSCLLCLCVCPSKKSTLGPFCPRRSWCASRAIHRASKWCAPILCSRVYVLVFIKVCVWMCCAQSSREHTGPFRASRAIPRTSKWILICAFDCVLVRLAHTANSRSTIACFFVSLFVQWVRTWVWACQHASVPFVPFWYYINNVVITIKLLKLFLSWSVRNSSTITFSAIMDRMLGMKKGNTPEVYTGVLQCVFRLQLVYTLYILFIHRSMHPSPLRRHWHIISIFFADPTLKLLWRRQEEEIYCIF